MNLLIKGVEMPDSCLNCRFRATILKNVLSPTMRTSAYACLINGMEVNNWYEKKHKDCPLVEIPTPRGRLIDADELIERIERFRDIHNYYPADIDATMRWFINQICGAKTIIEAENSSAIDDDVKKYCDYLKSETYDFCNRIENGEVSE